MKIHRVSGCCLQAAAMVRRMLVVQRKLHHTARMLADSRARFFSLEEATLRFPSETRERDAGRT